MDRAPSVTPAAALSPVDVVRLLRAAGGELAVQAVLHAKLARVEWEAEKGRLLKMVVMIAIGFGCLLCTLLFAGGLVLAATWGTAYFLPAAAALVLGHGLAVAAAWARIQTLSALGEQAFAASWTELAADAAMLKESR